MDEAQDRCQAQLIWSQLVYAAWCYGLCVLPPLLFALAFFGLSVHAACPADGCRYVYPPAALRPVQNALLALLVVYACVGSAGFVHRRAQLWQRWLGGCRLWSAAVVVVLVDIAAHGQVAAWPVEAAPCLAAAVLGGPLVQLVVTEPVERQEYKYNIRYQKWARLEFDTKLGMNSPF